MLLCHIMLQNVSNGHLMTFKGETTFTHCYAGVRKVACPGIEISNPFLCETVLYVEQVCHSFVYGGNICQIRFPELGQVQEDGTISSILSCSYACAVPVKDSLSSLLTGQSLGSGIYLHYGALPIFFYNHK